MTTGRATTIFYPESDGMPLPDGEYQAPLLNDTVSPLRVHFRDVEGAHANGNTFLYYVEGECKCSRLSGLLRGLRPV